MLLMVESLVSKRGTLLSSLIKRCICALPIVFSSCMIWPGLTAFASNRPDDQSRDAERLLPLIAFSGVNLLGFGASSLLPTCGGATNCQIFVSTATWTPGLASPNTTVGNLASADALCQSEALSLGLTTGAYKALLLTTTSERNPANAGWVMHANTVYSNASLMADILTTDSQSSPTVTTALTGSSTLVWTGIALTSPISAYSGYTCGGWTDSSAIGQIKYGDASGGANNPFLVSNPGIVYCNTGPYHLYCLQQ